MKCVEVQHNDRASLCAQAEPILGQMVARVRRLLRQRELLLRGRAIGIAEDAAIIRVAGHGHAEPSLELALERLAQNRPPVQAVHKPRRSAPEPG